MSTTNDDDFRRMMPHEVRTLLKEKAEIFILDLRQPRAYHMGHIPEAILLPADDFADRYAREVSPDDPILLVCEKGLTSIAAAKFLVNQGFTNVATMSGGMNDWEGELTKNG
jgi:rhodanese-related sulfurtransferase